MNLFQEIKLLFSVKKPGEDLIKEVAKVKDGWKTTEFWVKILGDAVTLWGALKGFVPPEKAALIVAITSSVYGTLRTILKVTKGTDLPDYSGAPASTPPAQ